MAYFLFLSVLLLCLIFSMVAFGNPRSLSFLFRSLMLRLESSSSVMPTPKWSSAPLLPPPPDAADEPFECDLWFVLEGITWPFSDADPTLLPFKYR